MKERWIDDLVRRMIKQAEALVSAHAGEQAELLEKKCESPIERLFAAHLAQVAPFHAHAPCILAKDVTNQTELVCKAIQITDDLSPDYLAHRPFVVWSPQIEVGEFRADFMLVGCWKGMNPYDAVCVVVECDGFEWHERTKEQAVRDREKDRTLQEYGCKVFRFLGTEIWTDPGKCADRVIEFIHYCLSQKKPIETES